MPYKNVENVVEGLGKQDKEFNHAIRKWKPLLCKLIKTLAQITEEDEEDVFGSFMVRLVEAKVYYDMELYRYKNKILVIEKSEGPYSKMSVPFHYKKRIVPFWVRTENLAKVKKAKFDSFLYRVMNQHFIDSLNALYTAKRNYTKEAVIPEKEKLILPELHQYDQFICEKVAQDGNSCKVRVWTPEGIMYFWVVGDNLKLIRTREEEERGPSGVRVRSKNVTKLEQKNTFKAKKVYSHIGLYDKNENGTCFVDIIGGETDNPERKALLSWGVNRLTRVFTREQNKVFEEIIREQTCSYSRISKKTGVPMLRVKAHVEEILRRVDNEGIFQV